VASVSVGRPRDGNRAHLLDLVGNRRRRRLLSLLWEEDGAWTVEELATRLATAESDAATETPPEERLEAVRIELYHTHLPKLAELGVVEYDRSEESPRVARSDDGQVRAAVDRTLASLDHVAADPWRQIHDRHES
jgi:hypothetical protein